MQIKKIKTMSGGKKYQTDNKPERIIVHHTAGGYTSGIDGVHKCAEYHVHGKLWPGIGYHYWIPFTPDQSRDLYQLHDHDVACYGAGLMANHNSIHVAVQGNFRSAANRAFRCHPRTDGEPNAWQVDALKYLVDLIRLPPFGHCEIDPVSKPFCPGDTLLNFCQKYRYGDEKFITWEQRQEALKQWYHGPIDGIPGNKTRHAIEEARAALGLDISPDWTLELDHALRQKM